MSDTNPNMPDPTSMSADEIVDQVKTTVAQTLEKHNMTKVDMIKGAAQFIVGTSVGFTVKNVIENNTEPETKKEQIEVYIGSAAIGASVAHATRGWLDSRIDFIAGIVKQVKTTWADTEVESTTTTP